MTNNIRDNKNSQATTTTTISAAATSLAVLNSVPDDSNNNTANNNQTIIRNSSIIPKYAHGIWYQEIEGPGNILLTQQQSHQQQQLQQQRQQFNNNNHNPTEIVTREYNNTSNNNNCDIIVVDIEEEQYIQQQKQQSLITTQQQHFSIPPKYIIDANMKYHRQRTTTSYDVEKVVNKFNDNSNNINDIANDVDDDIDNIVVYNIDNEHFVVDGADDDDDDDDDESFASMETLSDNVSIWIDGEKHWVAGVDENTTCSDLIWALLNYQNGQQQQHEHEQHQQHHQQHVFKVEDKQEIDRITNNHVQQQQQQQPNKQQQHLKNIPKSDVHILYTDNKPKKYYSTDTINTNFEAFTNFATTITNNNVTSTSSTSTTSPPTATTTTTSSLNQSMPINTKENCKILQNSSTTGSPAEVVATKKSTVSSSSSTPVSTTLAPFKPPSSPPPAPPQASLLPFTITLPCGITTASQLATEYVIVKQYHHCEEYLDGSTKVFDVLPPRDSPHKKECELLLRHLGPAPAAVAIMYNNNSSNSNNNGSNNSRNNNAATPQLSSLISTDKDSGMGSPVGSARSAKFRRRKHKSSQWLAQANTLHPKLSRCTANERLMKIILAQDETIQRQLSLLREKERQITKIEEEKHRKRERELGKNYLLETYLNGLDEAECEPEIRDGEEIFIDEPYQRSAKTTAASAAGIVTSGISLEALDMMAKHKFKETEIKKEKKKKRYKDKPTKEEQCRDICGKTNKTKDKDKERERDKEKPDVEQIYQAMEGPAGDVVDIANEQEIEMQILWLEKIYLLNKQLQKEEELSAKLHAKVRKHQLRKAQHTQKEVQFEIDKLDNNLALQCGDIRKVEANLMETNEQLQKKLQILERLSMEYLQEQQQQQQQYEITANNCNANENEQYIAKSSLALKDDNRKIIGNLEKSIDLQKLSLNNIKSTQEFNKIQKCMEKSNLDIKEMKLKTNCFKTTAATTLQATAIKYDTPSVNCIETINHIPMKQKRENENSIQNLTRNLNPFKRQQINNTQDYQQQVIATSITTAQTATTTSTATTMSSTTCSNTTMTPLTTTTSTCLSSTTSQSSSSSSLSPSCMFIDKNMLSSLQVQNAKTIKKQMFHTQTSAAAQATTSPTTTSSQLPVIVTTTAAATIETNAFPKQQFQHVIQHLPKAFPATKILTSRPQLSHQIPTSSSNTNTNSTSIVILKHPSALTTPLPIPLQLPASSSLSTTTTLPSSPTPSLMAMNTVDISQLGTLV